MKIRAGFLSPHMMYQDVWILCNLFSGRYDISTMRAKPKELQRNSTAVWRKPIKQFSNFKEGWKTDPGMWYILFVPPSTLTIPLTKCIGPTHITGEILHKFFISINREIRRSSFSLIIICCDDREPTLACNISK